MMTTPGTRSFCRVRSHRLIALALLMGTLAAAEDPRPSVPDAMHREWVQRCLHDFGALHPGMTRADVDARFPRDGGLGGAYTHPKCPYFKIDIVFTPTPGSHPPGVGNSPDDRVVSLSKPYLETPFSD